MKRNNKRYSDQFKKDAVRLVDNRGIKTIPQIAKELGVSQSMLYRWREQYSGELSEGNPLSAAERAEMESMRRRMRDLEAENAFLKKAAALFAKDVK